MFSDKLGFNPFDKKNNPLLVTNKSKQKRFMDSFAQTNIYVYNGNPRKKISSMHHTYKIDECLNANINKRSDVYFYINGGRKIYAIKQFTCCFCDMDAGRDKDGKYFKPSVVMVKKKQFLAKINAFPVKPSWVVDTRNGYQCYWIFDKRSRSAIGGNKTLWSGLQKKLVNYFGGDARAIKPNQIYRVPYTWWRKEWENKSAYFTSILSGSTGKPVDVDQLKNALSGQSATVTIDNSKTSENWYEAWARAYRDLDKSKTSHNVNDVFKKVSQVIEDFDSNKKVYGLPTPVIVGDTICDQDSCDTCDCSGEESSNESCSTMSYEQTALLKTVVDFLNQVATPLWFSKNQFLSRSARELANKLSDQFCIG